MPKRMLEEEAAGQAENDCNVITILRVLVACEGRQYTSIPIPQKDIWEYDHRINFVNTDAGYT